MKEFASLALLTETSEPMLAHETIQCISMKDRLGSNCGLLTCCRMKILDVCLGSDFPGGNDLADMLYIVVCWDQGQSDIHAAGIR